jgi:hypothetical protein
MKPAALDLHIETLVLEGVRLGDPHAIRAAIEAELARLFTERGISLAHSYTVDRISSGTFTVGQRDAARPEAAVGRQAAAAIYQGVNR